jgi:tetratricopeptide (TPR) repeat protein
MVRDIHDPKDWVPRKPLGSSRRYWSKLIWFLLLAAMGGGAAMHLGPRFYEWVKNYQCAKKGVEDKKPEAAFQCLERFSPKTANLLFQLGIDLRRYYLAVINQWLEGRQFQKALEASQAAWRKFPWEPAFLGDQALALFGLGKFQESVGVLETFLKSPQIEQWQKRNGARISLMATQIYLGAQNVAECEKYLRKAFEIEPDNAAAHLLYARLEAFRQNMGAMAQHYEKVLRSSPKELVWQDFFLLALHCLTTNQTEKFQRIFAQSRRDFPNASGFHLLLAVKHLQDGNYASAYYEVLFEKEVGLTDAAFFKTAIQEIEKRFEDVFQNRPAEVWLLPLYRFIHGKQAYESRDYPRAFAWMEQSLQTDEHPLQSLYLGRALAGMGQTDKAIGYYGKALDRQETFALATAELAGLYLQRGAAEAAQHIWSKALSTDPQIANLSPVGAQLAALKAPLPAVEVSEEYTQKLTDNLMQVQLNQMIVNSFVNALHF